jgi:hypothetical protein
MDPSFHSYHIEKCSQLDVYLPKTAALPDSHGLFLKAVVRPLSACLVVDEDADELLAVDEVLSSESMANSVIF